MIVTVFLWLKLIDEDDSLLGILDVVTGCRRIVFICKLNNHEMSFVVEGILKKAAP